MDEINLSGLYDVQSKLKERINYTGSDKFEKITLAFIVEVAECANDWRGFKYWSKNQQPKETLLEEYVDGLHFVLEIGLDIGHQVRSVKNNRFKFKKSVTEQLSVIISLAGNMIHVESKFLLIGYYDNLINYYIGLGEMLGFTWNEIEAAYMDKNQVNHERQDSGY